MSKPGRHTYVVRYEENEPSVISPLGLHTKFSSVDSIGKNLMDQNSNNENGLSDKSTKYSIHKCIIQAREEEVPPFAKPANNKNNERVFNKEASVFRDWKEPPSL